MGKPKTLEEKHEERDKRLVEWQGGFVYVFVNKRAKRRGHNGLVDMAKDAADVWHIAGELANEHVPGVE